MSIKIVTDSAADFTQEEIAKLGIEVIPMIVTFGNDSYRDGLDLDHDGFFNKLIETDELPRTSQITPFQYEEFFQGIVEAGDEVLCLVLSSELSGCYQSACLAANEFDGKVCIVDSLNACIGQRILVELAVQKNDGTHSLAELAQIVENEKKNIRLIALLDTLEYLKKGGRISATVATAGTLLSIKPVIAIEAGKVVLLGMARGSKNGNNKLKELINKEGGINFDKPYALAYSGLTHEMLDKYLADNVELYEGYASDLPITSIGCIIGTHIGPGAIAAAFFV